MTTSAGRKTQSKEIRLVESGAGRLSAEAQDAARRFVWEIASIKAHMDELRDFRAMLLGVTGPQWTILMALADTGTGRGLPLKAIAKMMHVDPSFITTQSKILEKKGFLVRNPSMSDARVVEMSLADKTYRHILRLEDEERALREFIFHGLDNDELTRFVSRLTTLSERLRLARLKVAFDSEVSLGR